MVGPTGEVFVVDWGLSKVLEAVHRDELAKRTGPEPVDTERRHGESPLLTLKAVFWARPITCHPSKLGETSTQ